MSALGRARIDGPQPDHVVLVAFYDKVRIQERSRLFPDTLFVDLNGNKLARGGIVISPPRRVRLLLLALAGRFGLWVDKGELVDLLWGADSGGGPDDAVATLEVYLVHAGTIAALIGYRIENRKYQGAVRAYPAISTGRERSVA
jgi:hypothetical protein